MITHAVMLGMTYANMRIYAPNLPAWSMMRVFMHNAPGNAPASTAVVNNMRSVFSDVLDEVVRPHVALIPVLYEVVRSYLLPDQNEWFEPVVMTGAQRVEVLSSTGHLN